MRWDAFDDPTDTDIQAFLQRLPPTLTKLELFPPSHFGYIRDDLNIEHLGMTSCTALDVLMLFQRLKPRREDQYVVKPLPRLKCLMIGEGDDSLDYLGGAYSIAALGMLDGRLDHSNQAFHLDMPSVHIEWLPEVRERLAQLVESGFDIRINERVECYSFPSSA
jgi:hypothetical protein